MSDLIGRIVPHLGGVQFCDRSCIIGIENAAVLPVPVCAHPNTSFHLSITGIACSWIGVGVLYHKSARGFSNDALSHRSENCVIGKSL